MRACLWSDAWDSQPVLCALTLLPLHPKVLDALQDGLRACLWSAATSQALFGESRHGSAGCL